MPMLYENYSSEACPIQTASLTIDDKATIKYIGGYTVKKLLKNRCLSNEKRLFLQKCVVNSSNSSLCDVTDSLVQLLLNCEKAFPENSSIRFVNLSSLWKSLQSAERLHHTRLISDSHEISNEILKCAQKITSSFFKIRVHRFYGKTANEKIGNKSVKSRSL